LIHGQPRHSNKTTILDSKRATDLLFHVCAVEVVEGVIRQTCVYEATTMIAVGIILSFVSLVFLCWLLFTLAVHALPVFVAFAAGLAAYHSGSGEFGAFLVGLIAGALTLAAGQIAVASFRSPVIRAAIALVFAVPAAMAGYHAALGLAQLGVPTELWQRAFALIGAVAAGTTAWARLALLNPPDMGSGDGAGGRPLFPAAPAARDS
jgi:hypothetical protein